MVPTLLNGYPDVVGKRQIFAGFGTGPKSYSRVTGDPVTVPGYQNYIDQLQGSISVSGTYEAIPQPLGTGARQSWIYRWYVVSTGVEVANAVDLSAESVSVSGYGGTY